MNIFKEIQDLVNQTIREDEQRKINYILYGEIPEELKCPICKNEPLCKYCGEQL